MSGRDETPVGGVGEPPSGDVDSAAVWRDIADELEDHLACSERQAEIGGIGSDEARARAVERLGSPRAIALQLYWIAMKDRILAYRSVVAASILIVLAVVVGLVVVVQGQNRVLGELRAAVEGLGERDDAASYSWGSVTIEHGALPSDGEVSVTIEGPALGGDEVTLFGTPEGTKTVFDPVHVGRYDVDLFVRRQLPWGWYSTVETVTLYPSQPVTLDVKLPPSAELLPVGIEVNWPPDLEDAGLLFTFHVSQAHIEPYESWQISNAVTFIVGVGGAATVNLPIDLRGPSSFVTNRQSFEYFAERRMLGEWGGNAMLPAFRRFDPAHSRFMDGIAKFELLDDQSGHGLGRLETDRSTGTTDLVFDWTTDPARAGEDGVIEWRLELSDEQWEHIRGLWREYRAERDAGG